MPKKSYVTFLIPEQSAPSTPPSGFLEPYVGTDKILYTKDSGGDVKALSGGLGYVNHGSTAGTARPTGYDAVMWYGSVTPTNAIDGDIWIDTT